MSQNPFFPFFRVFTRTRMILDLWSARKNCPNTRTRSKHLEQNSKLLELDSGKIEILELDRTRKFLLESNTSSNAFLILKIRPETRKLGF